MFGIPPLYYPQNTPIQPRCLIGFSFITFGGSTEDLGGSIQTQVVKFDTTTYPFRYLLIRPQLYNGFNQALGSQYHIFCFDQ